MISISISQERFNELTPLQRDLFRQLANEDKLSGGTGIDPSLAPCHSVFDASSMHYPNFPHLTRPSTLASSAQSSTTASVNSIELARPEHPAFSGTTLVNVDAQAVYEWPASRTDHQGGYRGPYELRSGVRRENADCTTVSSQHKTGKLPYYCPLCHERGSSIFCKAKHDWKRHVRKFHETNTEWRCSVCSKVFVREVDAKRHLKGHRGCADLPSITLPKRCVYACGFMHCRYYTDNFEDWSGHVADCMEKHPGETWSYNRRVRNILKHGMFAQQWREVRDHWLGVSHLDSSAIHWTVESSNQLREQLERGMCGADLRGTLEQLLRQGHPHHHLSDGFNTAHRGSMDVSMDGLHAGDSTIPQQFPESAIISQYDEDQMQLCTPDTLATATSFASQRAAMRNSHPVIDPSLTNGNDSLHAGPGQMSTENERITWESFLLEGTYPASTNTTPPLPEEQLETHTTPTKKFRTLLQRTSY